MYQKVFLIIVLSLLYIFLFGIKSIDRFMDDSIVTIKKELDMTSIDMDIRPGAHNTFY